MDFAHHAEVIARALLGEPNKALSTKAQLRYGANGSLAVNIAGQKAGTWYCFEPPEASGGMLDLIRREKNVSNGEAFKWLRSIGIETGPRQPAQKVIATYVYVDANGKPIFRVCRWSPKKRFSQQRYDRDAGRFIGGEGC